MHIFVPSFKKLSQTVSNYGADTNDEPLTDGQTDTQNIGGYNVIPRHFFVAGHKNYKGHNIVNM